MKTVNHPNILSQRLIATVVCLLVALSGLGFIIRPALAANNESQPGATSAVNEAPSDDPKSPDNDPTDSTLSTSTGEPRHPRLNVLENEEIGSEMQFIRIAEHAEGLKVKDYERSEIVLQPDKIYDMVVCVHNAADPELGEFGLARNVQLSLELPNELSPNHPGEIYVELSSTSTIPGVISNVLGLTASAPLSISTNNFYISRYTQRADFYAETTLEFEEPNPDDGKLHGTSQLGDISAGEENMQYIFVSFKTTAAEETSEPEPITTLLICIGIAIPIGLASAIVGYKLARRHDEKYDKRFDRR